MIVLVKSMDKEKREQPDYEKLTDEVYTHFAKQILHPNPNFRVLPITLGVSIGLNLILLIVLLFVLSR